MSAPDTADIIAEAQREFADMAPSILKKKVVALVFLPWLTRYTSRLIGSAKEEERRAILAGLSNRKAPAGKPEWRAGYKAAIETVRDMVRSRSSSIHGAS